jgi:uncharacterized protein (DUF1330 family)
MAAYVIADIRIRNESLLQEYGQFSESSIAKYGGRFIARGGTVETMEGDWSPNIVVIVEFPTIERAREWYASPEYAEALKIREEAMERQLIFIEGVPP